MQKLVEGIQKFQNEIFGSKQQLFESLAEGQKPLALFITCSDSRIDPNLLTQTEPGELFVLRNAGNIVPPYGDVQQGEAATIEFAVRVLGVKDVIICGHSRCGAMSGLLDTTQLENLPAVRSWLSHAESTRRLVEERHQHVTEPAARLAAAVEANVLVQLDHLKTHPSVNDAIERQALNLHGWTYRFETGEVFSYDGAEGRFVPIQRARSTSSSPVSELT